MDAEQTLEYVRRLATFEVKLESGRRYSLVLPDMSRFIANGGVPLPLMKQVAGVEQTPPDESAPEDQKAAVQLMYEFYDGLLAESIVEIDGEPVEMTKDAVRYIPEDDREELLEYLKREKDPTMADA